MPLRRIIGAVDPETVAGAFLQTLDEDVMHIAFAAGHREAGEFGLATLIEEAELYEACMMRPEAEIGTGLADDSSEHRVGHGGLVVRLIRSPEKEQ